MYYGLIVAIGIIAITSFPNITVIVICVVLGLFLIRWLADLYWWLKDRGDI
jgi:hypothetical protein